MTSRSFSHPMSFIGDIGALHVRTQWSSLTAAGWGRNSEIAKVPPEIAKITKNHGNHDFRPEKYFPPKCSGVLLDHSGASQGGRRYQKRPRCPTTALIGLEAPQNILGKIIIEHFGSLEPCVDMKWSHLCPLTCGQRCQAYCAGNAENHTSYYEDHTCEAGTLLRAGADALVQGDNPHACFSVLSGTDEFQNNGNYSLYLCPFSRSPTSLCVHIPLTFRGDTSPSMLSRGVVLDII